MASSSSSSDGMLGELVSVKTALEEAAKEVFFGENYKLKSSSHSEGEETTLFKFLEENSKYYGGDRIEGERNMTTDIKTTGDGQNLQQHLLENRQNGIGDFDTSTERTRTTDVLDSQHTNSDFGASFSEIEPGSVSTVPSADSAFDTSRPSEHLIEKRRDRQNGMSDFETSTEPKGTADVLETQQTNSDFGASFPEIDPGSVSTVPSADSALGTSHRSEHLIQKRTDRQNGISDFDTSTQPTSTADVLETQQTNSDLGAASFSKIEPGSVSTMLSADSALDTTLRSEPSFTVSLADHDTHKEKSSRPPVLDYLTTLNEHKCGHINLFEAVDWFKCIANVHPVDQRSELDKEVGMFCRDWLTHHRDPSIQYLDTSFDADMEKVYESDVYMQVQDRVKTFDEDTVVAIKSFIDMMPMTEQVFKYEVNWALVDKHNLHEKMRPWISIIVNNSAYEVGNIIVSNILESLKSHGSASSILKNVFYLKDMIDEAETEMLFLKMWKMIFCEIDELVHVGGNNPLGVETLDDTTKLKDWALSVEINWDVFDQHELHEKLSPWIRKEFMKLLKKVKASAVDEVIGAIRKQNSPSQMLELLAPSLEDDTEFVVKTIWRTLLILVKILETDPVWNSEESSDRVVGGIKRKRGYAYNYTSILRQMKMLDFEMLCEANRLKGIIPRNIEELSFYKIDWAVSDKEELHNRFRPWIFREIRKFVRKEKVATSVVDSIVLGIKDHANAKDILKLVYPSLGKRSFVFVLTLWIKLIWQIQLAQMRGLDGERSTVEISQYGDRYSRYRHFMFDVFDYENLVKLKQISEAMPKTKEELFSCEIKWDVYEKHDLQRTMREGICAETLELTRQKQEVAGLAFDRIMWSIFDYHVSASQREFYSQKEAVMVVEGIMSRLDKYHASPNEMMEFLEPIFGSSGSEKLVMKMWYALVCSIKIAEARVEKKRPPSWESAVFLPEKTRW